MMSASDCFYLLGLLGFIVLGKTERECARYTIRRRRARLLFAAFERDGD